MKRKVSAANLSIAITFLLILLSFGFGYRSYSQAEQRVVSDLNQALQRTVLQHKGLWLNADTIQTYAKLQEVMGTPVSVSGFHRAFTEALPAAQLPCCSAYPSRQFRQHCYWQPCCGEDSLSSISTGTQRLMPVTGSNKKTSLPSATFRFPSRKPASITNSRKS